MGQKYFNWKQCLDRPEVAELSNEYKDVLGPRSGGIKQAMEEAFTKTFEKHLQGDGRLLIQGEGLVDPTLTTL